jgi:CubicO group peptidase (beta-lactamase class C family)
MRVAAVLLLSLLAVPALAGDKDKGKKPSKPSADAAPSVVEGEAGKAMDERVAKLDEPLGGFNGCAFVAVGDKVLLEKGYGVADARGAKPMRADALWDWASITKQFTAAALLRLEAKKKLSLDDPLSKHFKECPKDKAKVTLRQLLNHTSGIQSGFRNEWKFDGNKRDSLVECVLHLPMESKPGEKFEYSNSGYGFAAAVLEQVSGKTWEEFCVEELFRPAGMKDACTIGWKSLDLGRVPRQERGTKDPFPYGPVLNWGYRGCGGAVATVREMGLWDRALRGDKILGPAQKKAFYEPALQDYALGWTVRRDGVGDYVEHTGGVGKNITWYRRYLEKEIVVALALNYETKDNLTALVDELARLAEKAR